MNFAWSPLLQTVKIESSDDGRRGHHLHLNEHEHVKYFDSEDEENHHFEQEVDFGEEEEEDEEQVLEKERVVSAKKKESLRLEAAVPKRAEKSNGEKKVS